VEEGRSRRRISARHLIVAVLVAISSVGATVGTSHSVSAATRATHFRPQLRSVPHPGTSSELQGVTCVSSSSCWAVGDYEQSNAELDQVLHWNGSKWSRVSTPNPGGTAANAINTLFGVTCTSSSNCWAVGYYVSGAELNQTLHWNGSTWTNVTAPNPGGTSIGFFNDLFGVACTSASNCWAVGEYGSFGASGETILNQALHWNGTAWSVVPTPDPFGNGNNDANALESVRCLSSTDCWAVGTYGFVGSPTILQNEVLGWDGTNWNTFFTPNPAGSSATDVNALSAVACNSANDCWAVGDYGTENSSSITLLNQTLRWHGGNWNLVGSPDPDGTGGGAQNGLFGVTCTGTSNCWAAGYYGSISGGIGVLLNQLLRWNGSTWSLVTTPQPGGTANDDENELQAVRCASASSCWAVGRKFSGTTTTNEALRWSGSSWANG
jgi:hypothetical protein